MYIRATILYVFLNLSLALSSPVKRSTKPATCQACHPLDENKINIHLVPHSHDDVGWLKTVDQYYYGSQKHIQYAGVQYIISSSIEALLGHPDRRYIQVESAFFWKWWQHQEEPLKQQVIELVKNGQLEIINGAWSMNDEAASHYHSTIDQFTWGFRFLNDTFGECATPKIGWQIDPFGHSREHASLMAQLGFQGLVLGRIDFRDKEKRRAEKNLDFIWQGSANLDNSNIFTTIFPDFYGSISGYCFDVLCNDEAINDDERSSDYNLRQKVDGFAKKMDQYKKYYQTSNFLVPMGGDFNYQAAEINFSNMDKLIKGFKDHETYNVFYSTPSCYVKAVHDEVNRKSIKLKKKTDDFFPYASDSHSVWTGYFTSRPTSKRFERLGNNILQASKQLATFSRINGRDEETSLNDLREVMGIMQHHDVITGTEKQAVARDYAKLLTRAIEEVQKPTGVIIGDLLKKDSGTEVDLKLSTCLLANVSICEISQNERFLVAVYNPLSRPVTHYVRLPVDWDSYNINGPDGQEEYDIFDSLTNFDYVKERIKPSKKELVFAATKIPPLGVKLYYVQKLKEGSKEYRPFEEVKGDGSYGTQTNGFTIDGSTGRLSSITIRGDSINVTQDFYNYPGGSAGSYKSSGAYIFRPTISEAKPINSEPLTVKVTRGKLADEVLQIYNSEVTQIIRAYKDDSNDDGYVEFDWLVGDLKWNNHEGREIITRFTVKDFANKGIFYTDSNGREQIRRELDKRSDYEYNKSDEPVATNYYPVTSKIVIKDEGMNLEVAVLNDRAQGGTSLTDGAIELMVHRRLVRDDGFGVGEPLNEEEYGKGLYARGQHYLTFGSIDSDEDDKSTAAFERDLEHKKLLAPWVLLTAATTTDLDSLPKVRDLVNFEFEGLTRSLPENVQILTLEPWRDDTYILRLEHTLEKNEDDILSKPITVDLEDLFTTFDISEIGETTLGANQWLDDYEYEEKLIWNDEVMKPLLQLDTHNPLQIQLNPMQIRTLIIKVVKK